MVSQSERTIELQLESSFPKSELCPGLQYMVLPPNLPLSFMLGSLEHRFLIKNIYQMGEKQISISSSAPDL